ncbi:hypothetical protein ACFL1U_00945 [Patescibacteria group bacterium]
MTNKPSDQKFAFPSWLKVVFTIALIVFLGTLIMWPLVRMAKEGIVRSQETDSDLVNELREARPLGVDENDLSAQVNSTDTEEWSDQDEDGLSDQEEETIGTDPQNPDTDDDGYSDLVEVNSGNNPLQL